VAAAKKSGARLVTSTYNEPLITSEWAVEVFSLAKREGITCGYVSNGNGTPEALAYIRPYVDLYKVDLKGFTDEFYVKLCGAHLQPVLDTLVYLKRETDVWFEITTLLIPGKNDSDAELEAMCAWIMRELGTGVPIHFTAFHPDYKMTDLERTPGATLTRARDIALRAGIRYVYTGNVWHYVMGRRGQRTARDQRCTPSVIPAVQQ